MEVNLDLVPPEERHKHVDATGAPIDCSCISSVDGAIDMGSGPSWISAIAPGGNAAPGTGMTGGTSGAVASPPPDGSFCTDCFM